MPIHGVTIFLCVWLFVEKSIYVGWRNPLNCSICFFVLFLKGTKLLSKLILYVMRYVGIYSFWPLRCLFTYGELNFPDIEPHSFPKSFTWDETLETIHDPLHARAFGKNVGLYSIFIFILHMFSYGFVYSFSGIGMSYWQSHAYMWGR